MGLEGQGHRAEGLCELGTSRGRSQRVQLLDRRWHPRTAETRRHLQFVLILYTEFSEGFATPSPGFGLIIVDFCSPAQCISSFSHHLTRSRFCIAGALGRIFLYFNPKDFSFPVVLLGVEVGKPQGLLNKTFFSLKLWDCLGFRILVLSNYDPGTAGWALVAGGCHCIRGLSQRGILCAHITRTGACPVLTAADNVLRDGSGKGVVLQHSPSPSWWAVGAAAWSQSEVTGNAVTLQLAAVLEASSEVSFCTEKNEVPIKCFEATAIFLSAKSWGFINFKRRQGEFFGK